ncbi:hypothetical protein [Streptomyces sp. NPDC093225]|uniref:hypothetical protein n=1 Tax=Streptomyces sp. NPDC093225 TaxID=3366034 RepID=UPI003812E8D8
MARSLVPTAQPGAARRCWYDVLPLGAGRTALVVGGALRDVTMMRNVGTALRQICR